MIIRVALVLCRLAMDAHPSDGAEMKTSQIALRGRVSTIMLVGVFYSFGCPHINLWVAANLWNPSSFASLVFPF
jgi:hypothetical protein